MFQFPTFAYPYGYIWSSTRWVAPFGNLRIKGYLLLPVAYRSLSRPSSPPRPKASAMRPCLLSSHRSPLYCYKVDGSMFFLFYFLLLQYVNDLLSVLRFTLYVIRCLSFVENNGFEPLTPCVQGRCSSQLS
jgi:hypothetical protein